MNRRRFLKCATTGLFLPSVSMAQRVVPTGSHGIDPVVLDWVRRVQVNGGARPGGATITAVNDLYRALRRGGCLSYILTNVLFVPDNLIAAITPLIKIAGNDPWVNSGLPAANLSINGLLGDGTNHLDTGVIPNTQWNAGVTVNAGMTIYNFTGNNTAAIDIGGLQGGSNLILRISNGGTAECQCYGSVLGTSMVQAANSAFTGFTAGERTALNRLDIYKANSSTALVSMNSATSAITQGNTEGLSLFCFDGHGLTQVSTKRFSYASIENGMPQSVVQAHFNAVHNFRIQLGGGFI